MSGRLRRRRRLLLRWPAAPPVLLALLALSGIKAPPALAAPGTGRTGSAGPGTLALSVSASPAHPGQLVLACALRGGSALGGRPVAFYVVSRQFKTPLEVPLGTARTATDGRASLSYKPTWNGRQRFVARLAEAGAHVPAASAVYNVSDATPGPMFAGANPGKPLASLSIVFLRVIQSLVALIWLGLILVLLSMRVWMPRLGRRRIG